MKTGGAVDPALVRFVKEKEGLARRIATRENLTPRQNVRDFFAAVQRDDRITSSNLFDTIEKESDRFGEKPSLPPELWGPIQETYAAYFMFRTWHPELLHRWGEEIIKSIPAGSIYFGGSDAGRFVVAALSKSHTAGDPFFTLTQNALADMSYVNYIRELYGKKISVPGLTESQRAFQAYMEDALKRKERGRLLEGEEVAIVNNRVQVSGEIAVMQINERLVGVIMEMNPEREFYLEEGRPMANLYSNSLPHGLIFRVTQQPLPRLSESIIEKDRDFWTGQVRDLLGKSLGDNMTVTEFCAWAENVYVRSNLAQFTGNRLFLTDKQAPQYYSQCRSAIASLYQWRSERDRADAPMLLRESELAHRQAVALSPYNPVVIGRYLDLLFQQRHTNDARALIQMTLRLKPEQRMDIDSDPLKKSLARIRTQAKEWGIVESR